ncbi:hypothetical protein HOF56_01630 [Candidatus Peribacteria bacterium]|nr:hypothetical protein [Candidatus Peribacteria bacterium]MBT4021307.1 hypothetical protein [Candidatus Peribacteria bacterium]MBT4241232.1 hypothetical protein [Candidatus Peribacteria bacterium]MBT4474257.1 hypothetical protein [Candidatus Peribacteria bacterium]
MLQSRRRRRQVSYRSNSGINMRLWKNIAVGILVVAVFVWAGFHMIRIFSPEAHGSKVPTSLYVRDRGRVDVVIGGEKDRQRAESGLKLYDGDRVITDGSAYAVLNFFDKTRIQLDTNTDVILNEVSMGQDSSVISLSIENGGLFIESGTGSNIKRKFTSRRAHFEVPPRSEVILGDDIYVFDSSGPGVNVLVTISSRTFANVIVGEGQQLIIDPIRLKEVKEEGGDPYELRSVLDDKILSSNLYLASRQVPKEEIIIKEESAAADEEGDFLVVSEPVDGELVQGGVVVVKGSVGSRIETVKVNGYDADLNDGEFRKEIALPEEESFSVDIRGESRDGLIIAEQSISLSQDINPPDAPVILSPGGSGDTIQISDEEFEISGTASSDAVGVIVNGYRLQKYVPGKKWSYIADSKLGNVRMGENIYEIVAIDRAGNTSDTSKIMIVWKAEPLVQIEDGIRDESEYIEPGSLRVIAPTKNGSTFITSDSEVLIEGETSADTHSLSINGFTLTLYEPGKETWNYIAKEDFGNYKDGTNRFTVVARNKDGKILDVVKYLIEKR